MGTRSPSGGPTGACPVAPHRATDNRIIVQHRFGHALVEALSARTGTKRRRTPSPGDATAATVSPAGSCVGRGSVHVVHRVQPMHDHGRQAVRAVTVIPGRPGAAALRSIDLPRRSADGAVIEMLHVGICGTDREILAGRYGSAPPGDDYLVIGHESLGRVVEAPDDGDLMPGDHVVGIVRRPDPVPCECCASGEWDLCTNGLYTERGIRQRHGYAAERVVVHQDFLVRIDRTLGIAGVLTEPASIVAKAWEGIERIASRSATWRPKRVLVTGAGPVGLLAALFGSQRGMELHVYDRVRDGCKPALAHALGATYHCADDGFPTMDHDAIIECTGAPVVIAEALPRLRPNGILCLTGVSSGGRRMPIDLGAANREAVLENHVVFGSVNANRRHYRLAVEALARADRNWLEQFVTRRVGIDRWREAFEVRMDDVKTVLDFAAGTD